MSQSTKEVFVLPLDTQAFINTEVLPAIEGMNNAIIKKDEFLFNASELVAEIFENAEVFDVEFWNGVFAFIEAQAISKFKIAESTAKNYSKDIVAFLKLRNPAILKPSSTNVDAQRKAQKKTENDALLDEFKNTSVESLASEVAVLAPMTDKDSNAKFKKLSSVLKLKKDAITKEQNEQSKLDISKFKENYRKDFKDILNDEFEFAQYLHANLENYRKAYNKTK
jgi:hypothetical protein